MALTAGTPAQTAPYEGPVSPGQGEPIPLAEQAKDPLEVVNRVSAVVGDFVVYRGVRPVAKVYRFIVPGPARQHFRAAGLETLF